MKMLKVLTQKRVFAAVIALIMLMLVTLLACQSSSPAPTNTANPVSDFVTAVEQALPSVVIIEVEFGPQGAPGNPSAQAGAGTGWVIDANGFIVTNNHIVEGAQTITITLSDGRKFTATAVKTSPDKDLAVVRISAQNLTTASIGDSSTLKMGQPVAAIGNSLNLGMRVTGGVVSRLNVIATYQTNNLTLTGLIETDAVINPGNSGGVLIDTAGNVVGITNGALEGTGTDPEGFDYAISINGAMPVIRNLISQMS